MDIYNFGEIIVDVLTNERFTSARESIRIKPKDALLQEICSENGYGPDDPIQEEVKLVLEVALLCTQVRASDRPTAREAMKLLSERNSMGKLDRSKERNIV